MGNAQQGTTRSPLKAEPGGQPNYNTKKSKNLQKPIREPRSQTTTARQRPPKTAKSRGGIHEGKNTHQENTATLTTSERTYTKNGIRSASRASGKFFFFVSRRASKAECNAEAPILPQKTQTPDRITKRHRTVHYMLTCLRMGAQARQKSPG